MQTLLVTYDIGDSETRDQVLTTIKRRAWAKLTDSTYAVATPESAQELYAALLPADMHAEDRLIVVGLARPFVGYTTEDVSKWIDAKLP